MKLYRTQTGVVAEESQAFYQVPAESWDALLCNPNLLEIAKKATTGPAVPFDPKQALAPIAAQEVWAAGVTYFRSRNARMEESKDAGGGTFYDRVYDAPRPELFFKGAGWRAIGPNGPVRIRSDASWSVPEPELTLVINPTGKLIGYTIGNDMSSRDIEGENPLYLPQAKVYEGSCALGPCILLVENQQQPIPRTTVISIEIERTGTTAFTGQTTLAELKRDPLELISYLFRDNTFPQGVFLMTGTGIVPADDFTLASKDIIRITIEGIGTLENYVAE